MRSVSDPLRALFLCLVIGATAGVQPLFAQQTSSPATPVVVLTRLSSPQGDPVAEKLASTITMSLGLVLRMTGVLDVKRADFLLPTESLERAVDYYRQTGASAAIYGLVAPSSDGSYLVELDVWSPARGGKPVSLKTRITNLLSSFELSDKLSLEIASTVTGRKLAEGTLEIKNVSSLTNYSVYADGHLLGRNRRRFRILTGKREIVVAKPGLIGDQPVEVFHVDIRKGATAFVELGSKTSPAGAESMRAYFVGNVGGGHPVYWTGGKVFRLPTGSFAAGGRAVSAAVDSQGKVFVAGEMGPSSSGTPVYWENGALHFLIQPSASLWGRATALTLDRSSNLFVCGSTNTAPAYWENGELHSLSVGGGNTVGMATAITVDAADNVYIAGYVSLFTTTPVYWENGRLHYLPVPSGSRGARATGIAIGPKGAVYVAGYSSMAANRQTPVYWKNGALHLLPIGSGASSGEARAVAVDRGGNLFVVGYADGSPLMWENGSPQRLPVGPSNTGGRALAVGESPSGVIYVAGWVRKDARTSPSYWKDGKLFLLGAVGAGGPAGAASKAEVVGIGFSTTVSHSGTGRTTGTIAGGVINTLVDTSLGIGRLLNRY